MPDATPQPPPTVGWRRAALAGLAVTVVQVALAVSLAGQDCFADSYRKLVVWDGGWYEEICKTGYRSPPVLKPDDLGNVAFFPGFPLLARQVAGLTGLPWKVALPLTAQLACWGFWTYVLLLCGRWRVPARTAAWAVALIAAHPAAFFLVAAYSESLFLAAVLGFVYWSGRRGAAAAALAALHGGVMSATRLFGLPLAAYPLVGAGRRRLVAALAVAAVAGLGAIGFFAYCQAEFGHWDQYLRTQKTGWEIKANYTGLLTFKIFRLGPLSHAEHVRPTAGWFNPNFYDRLFVVLTLAGFLLLGVLEWRSARRAAGAGWRERLGLYLAAVVLFYFPLAATNGVRYPGWFDYRMMGMLRYTFCTHVLLVLALAHLLRAGGLPRWAGWASAPAALASVALQLYLTYRFTHGQWVA